MGKESRIDLDIDILIDKNQIINYKYLMLFTKFNQKSPWCSPLCMGLGVFIYKQSAAFYENLIKHSFHLLFLLIITHKKSAS